MAMRGDIRLGDNPEKYMLFLGRVKMALYFYDVTAEPTIVLDNWIIDSIGGNMAGIVHLQKLFPFLWRQSTVMRYPHVVHVGAL